jgi:hypothetical protein
VSFIDPHASVYDGALHSDASADAVDVEVNVNAICDGLLVAVLNDDVLVEEAQGLLRGRGGQPDQECVEYSRTCAHTL